MLKTLVIFAGLEAAGFISVFYAFPLVRTFGHLDWAERYFGPASSYTVWRVAGIASIILGFIVLRYGYVSLSN